MEHLRELTFERQCPHCGGTIAPAAVKCIHCKAAILPEFTAGGVGDESAGGFDRMIIPIGRPASAIAAGYLGLFSVLPFFGVAAIVCSVFAIRTLKRNPRLSGWGRAIFGLFMGTVFTTVYGVALILAMSAGGRR